MNGQPLVSVIMACFNDEDYLRYSLESILNQTYINFEFIVVNDGSTDNTESILNSYDDERLKVVCQKNIGLPKSLNKCIDMSSGKYIIRMDSDDISMPTRIETQVNYMEKNTQIDIAGSFANIINEVGEKVGVYQKPISSKNIRSYMGHSSPLLHPTWIVRAEVFSDVGQYDNISPGQDFAFLIRAVRKGKWLANISTPCIYYRVIPDSLSRKNISKTFYTGEQLRKCYTENLDMDAVIEKIVSYNGYNKFFLSKFYNIRGSLLGSAKKKSPPINYILMVGAFLISCLNTALLKNSYHAYKANLIVKKDACK